MQPNIVPASLPASDPPLTPDPVQIPSTPTLLVPMPTPEPHSGLPSEYPLPVTENSCPISPDAKEEEVVESNKAQDAALDSASASADSAPAHEAAPDPVSAECPNPPAETPEKPKKDPEDQPSDTTPVDSSSSRSESTMKSVENIITELETWLFINPFPK